MGIIIGIYKITSPNKKIYIGQSVDIERRRNKYKALNCNGQTRLYNSLVKHGWDKHDFEIIHECNREDLNRLEVYYIQNYNSFNTSHGLNLVSGGGGNRVLSNETRMKISQSMKGDQRNLGRKHTDEAKNKMSKSQTGNLSSLGRKLSYETKKKLSDAAKKQKHVFGYKHTEESKIKMSEAQKGNLNALGCKRSDETIQKMSERMKGNKQSLGYKHTEETKKLMRLAWQSRAKGRD